MKVQVSDCPNFSQISVSDIGIGEVFAFVNDLEYGRVRAHLVCMKTSKGILCVTRGQYLSDAFEKPHMMVVVLKAVLNVERL